jgi:predicted  nucleic acid-binding Zn-ribbon protein
MALAELVQKMKSKKQAVHRSVFGHYHLEAVKPLALGKEIDADEVELILAAAGKSEDDLSRDVNLQQQRNVWHSQLMQNKQAVQDRYQAERDLAAASAALQAAYDKLQPAVELAQARLHDANYRHSTTLNAEAWLAGNLLDVELLQRESVLNDRLREINQELNPLLQDREHKRSSLMNAELCLRQITGRSDDAWPTFGTINSLFWRNKDTIPAQQRVDDLKNQLSQLEQAIRPRQQEQQRLQAELNSIHQQKLQP